MWCRVLGILGVCLCALAPRGVQGQKFDLRDGKILFTVKNAGDLLTGKILGDSLERVLGDSVADALNGIGLELGKNKVSFSIELDDERVGGKKCWYESELREPEVNGEIGTKNKVQFKADKDKTFMVTASLVLPLDAVLSGILHTKIRANAGFKCIHLKDVEFPFTTDVSAKVKVELMVFLNPEVMRAGNRVMLKLDPQIKLMEVIEEFNSSTDVQVEVFKGLRINFVEGLIEKLVNKAIVSRGESVISKQVDRLEQELQEFLDEDVKGKMIDLGNLIEDAEESGVLTELIGAAKLAFAQL